MLNKKELEQIKEEIIKEKKELELIKNILEEETDKIDISHAYIFKYGEISYLCKLEISNNHYIFKDLFNKQILFDIESNSNLYNRILMTDREYYNGKDKYAIIKPILEVDSSLIMYVDKQVPSYILQQMLFKLNNLEVNNPKTKRKKWK